jgi:hypothetical protein
MSDPCVLPVAVALWRVCLVLSLRNPLDIDLVSMLLMLVQKLWHNVLDSIAFDESLRNLVYTRFVVLKNCCWILYQLLFCALIDMVYQLAQPNAFSTRFIQCYNFSVVRWSSGESLFSALSWNSSAALQEHISRLWFCIIRVGQVTSVCVSC